MSPRPRREDYTVGWICALPIELAAAQEMLDEEHEDLERDDSDKNLYSLGSIAGHNVVIVCLPAGRIGNNPAAAVAMQMRATFKGIQFGLMVGIGGGVPSAETDVRLGDVVVSQPQGTFGGVVQYDAGKTTPSGFERTGSLNAPPQILLAAVARVRANELRGRSKLSKYISKISRNPKFQRDKVGPDILFEATYDHEGGPTCDKCSIDRQEARLPRDTKEVVIHYGTIASGNQVIRDGRTRDRLSSELGRILCFEMEAAGLMDSFPCLVIRGICDYADSHKNKTWQPYAAGVAAAWAKEVLSMIPPIDVAKTRTAEVAIRGPSGCIQGSRECRYYRGNNIKNSMHVAHFTEGESTADIILDLEDRSFRFQLPDISRFFHYLSKASKVFEFIIPSNSLRTRSERNNEQLKVYEYEEELSEKLEDIAPGTCRWILQNSSMTWWLEAQEPSLLLMTGGPGTGKTTLTTFIIQTLRHKLLSEQSGQVFAVLFALCNSHTNKSVSTIFSLALHQLLEQHPDLAEEAKIGEMAAPTSPRTERLWEMDSATVWRVFSKAISSSNLKRVYLVIDGLDSCDIDPEYLVKLLKKAPPQLRVLLSSQVSEPIRMELTRTLSNKLNYRVLDLGVEEAAINTDIDIVIRQEMEALAGQYSAQDTEEVSKSLQNWRSGTFLPIILILKKMSFTPIGEIKDILTSAKTHFEPLDETYRKLLLSIPNVGFPKDGSVTTKVLKYMLYMCRPPTVDELAFACQSSHSHSLSGSQLDNPIPGDRRTSFKQTLKLIGPIVRLRQEENTVEFFHSSAKTFLETHAFIDEPLRRAQIICPRQAHTQLAILCLAQLISSSEQPYPYFYEDFFARKYRNIVQKYTLLDYAFNHWMAHVRAALKEDSNHQHFQQLPPSDRSAKFELIKRLETLVSIANDPACQRFSAILASHKDGSRALWEGCLTLLELYILLDLGHLVREELSRSYGDYFQDKVSKQEFGDRVLYCAAINGSYSSFCAVYETLGPSGVDLTDPFWKHLLACAASSGGTELMKFILENRDVSPQEIAAAALAAARRDDGTLGVLATRANWEKNDSHGRNPLHHIAIAATDRADMTTQVVRKATIAFKEAGASLNTEDSFGNTILHYICWSNSLCKQSLLEDLCRNGADPHHRNSAGSLPLHLASRKASYDAFQFLLDETKIESLKSSSQRRLEAPKESGNHVTASSSPQQTVLIQTSSSTSKKGCTLQLDDSGPSSYTSKGGLTPLHWAMSRYFDTMTDDFHVFRSLLIKGFSLTLATRTGRTPLTIARGNKAVLYTLSLVYYRLDGADNMCLSTANTIEVLANAKSTDELFIGLQVERRFQYIIEACRANTPKSISASTQAFQRALMVYLIVPPVLLNAVLPSICGNTDDILNQIKTLGAGFEWDFNDPKVVALRQWQVLYELLNQRSQRQRQAQFVSSEKHVEDARHKHLFRRLLRSNTITEGNRSQATLVLQRHEYKLRKTIQTLDVTLMLESWNDLLWEVFEIFSLKQGQLDVVAAALELLPRSKSLLAAMGTKHFESSTKLDVLTRLEKKLLE